MTLIFWFLGFMIVGDLLAYLIGRFVEYEWGSYPSLVVFLALRAAPTRGPNGMGVSLRVDAPLERARCSATG